MSPDPVETQIDTDPDWQLVNPNVRQQAPGNPCLTVMVTGELYVNKAAHSEYFDGNSHAYLLVDRESGLLGIDPINSDDSEALKIVQDKQSGAKISIKSALSRLGIDYDAFEDSFQITPRELEDVIAIDLSPLMPEPSNESTEPSSQSDAGASQDKESPDADDSEAVEDNEGEDSTADPIEAIDSGKRQRLATHVDDALDETRIIEASSGELSEELGLELSAPSIAQNLRILREDDREYPFEIAYIDGDEIDDSFWRLRPTDDRDYSDGQTHSYNVGTEQRLKKAVENGVTDVHELAVELELETNEVRTAARQAGIYSQLTDAADGGGYGRGTGDD